MKTVANTFLKGLVFTLPLAVTFGLLYWLFDTSEQLLKPPLELMLPDGWYKPGMGVASAVLIIFVHGILVQAYLIKHVLRWLENLLGKIPFVKTLYGSVRDLMQLVARDKEGDLQKVVSVTIDGEIRMIGFVTNENVNLSDNDDLLAVYLPLSYQVGGYLVYLPRSRCQVLDISPQQAMRQVLTAHVSKEK